MVKNSRIKLLYLLLTGNNYSTAPFYAFFVTEEIWQIINEGKDTLPLMTHPWVTLD